MQVLTNDTEECSSPEEQEAANAALLRKRTGALERENRALREEAARLAAGADTAELAERQLLRDIAHQLCKYRHTTYLLHKLPRNMTFLTSITLQTLLKKSRLVSFSSTYLYYEPIDMNTSLI